MSMIFTQVIVTAFISLQWMIMYTYYYLPASGGRTTEQRTIINFVYWLTNYCYYLNNVKSFYLSMLTSRLLRQTFMKTLIKMLPQTSASTMASISSRNVYDDSRQTESTT